MNDIGARIGNERFIVGACFGSICVCFSNKLTILELIATISAVETKVYFTILDIPGSILVAGRPIEFEIDFGVFDFPPTIFVLEDTVLFEGDFTVGRLPPAVLVLVDSLSVEVYLGVFDSPPAIFVLEHACFFKRDFAIGGLPPAILVLIDALSLEVDLAVLNSPPAVLVLVNAGVLGVNLAVGVVPPNAVLISGVCKTGEFGVVIFLIIRVSSSTDCALAIFIVVGNLCDSLGGSAQFLMALGAVDDFIVRTFFRAGCFFLVFLDRFGSDVSESLSWVPHNRKRRF